MENPANYSLTKLRDSDASNKTGLIFEEHDLCKTMSKGPCNVCLTHSLIHHFETVPNSKNLQTSTKVWLLTLSQTPNFGLFQAERVYRRQFQI